MKIKICQKCSNLFVIKFWFKRWKQRYKCKKCGYVFQNKSRVREDNKLWKDFSDWKQTYQQLSCKYKLSTRSIQKHLDKILVKKKT